MQTHVMIAVQPYLNEILDGLKKIDMRASKNNIAPFQKVFVGDKILIKESGGPIVGQAFVPKVMFFGDLTPKKFREIIDTYKIELRIRDDFYERKKDSRFCSLIWLDRVTKVVPYPYEKHDQRSWIILQKNKTLF